MHVNVVHVDESERASADAGSVRSTAQHGAYSPLCVSRRGTRYQFCSKTSHDSHFTMASLTMSCSAPALNQIARQQPCTARPSCSLRLAPSTASCSASLRPHHAAFRSAARLPNLKSASRSRAAGLVVRAEQSYVMIKPDGVQRGLVCVVPSPSKQQI